MIKNKILLLLCLFSFVNIATYAQCKALGLPEDDLVKPLNFNSSKYIPRTYVKGQKRKLLFLYAFKPTGEKTIPFVVYKDINRTESQPAREVSIKGFYEYPNSNFDIFIVSAAGYEATTTYLVTIDTNGKILDYLEARVFFQSDRMLFKQHQMVRPDMVGIYELDVSWPQNHNHFEKFTSLKGTVYLTYYDIMEDGTFKMNTDGKMTNYYANRDRILIGKIDNSEEKNSKNENIPIRRGLRM